MDRVAAFKSIIGQKNQSYYLSYFRRCEERGYAPASWNWPVLFLGIFWLLWRHQYRWVGFTLLFGIGVSIVATIIADATGSRDTGVMVAYLFHILYQIIYLPLKVNGLYYEWCSQKIADAQTQLKGEEQLQKAWLEKKGGVNQELPLYLLVGFLLLTLLIGPPPELATQQG